MARTGWAGVGVLLGALLVASAPADGAGDGRSVAYSGTGCREVVTVLRVPADDVVDLVAPYRPATIEGEGTGRLADVAVAVARCERLYVDGEPVAPEPFSDVGVLIESPDGSDGFHFHQLWQVHGDARLAERLRRLGVPAAEGDLDLDLLTVAGDVATRGTGAVRWSGGGYDVGVAAGPPASQPDSSTTWWHRGSRGLVSIRYELTNVTLAAGAGTFDGSLPGAPAAVQAGGQRPGAGLVFAFDFTGTAALPLPPARRAVGEGEVFASVPSDRHPEGVAVVGDTVYVSTTAPLQQVGVAPPSRIYAFDRLTGAPRHHWTVEDEAATGVRGVAGLAVDRHDRIHAADVQGRVLRFAGGADAVQEVYATLPDLRPCPLAAGSSPCSPTSDDRPPFANDLAFDADGNLYVSDSWQATIFRVSPVDRSVEVWFQDPALDGVIGVNGLALAEDGASLYVTVTGDRSNVGRLYELPLRPELRTLVPVAAWPDGGADGVRVGASGAIYVSLFAFDQLAVLSPEGDEHRISHATFDEPAAFAFDDRRGAVIVPSHALMDPRPVRRLITTVYVGDRGMPPPAAS